MKITIQKIKLQNFKGIADLEADFNPGDNSIFGANRTGKTTIADAITWCLFGKDSRARTQFGIKTRDTEGNEIPHLTHSVTMHITADNTEYTLTRSYVEQWTRGQLKAHTTECAINGLKKTLREYQTFIATLIPEETFRTVTTPSYFTSLPWEKQREIIMALAPQVTTADVIKSLSAEQRESAETVIADMGDTPIEQYSKHLAATARQLQRDIDMIPVRIEENRLSLVADSEEDVKRKIAELQERIQQKNRDLFAGTSLADIRQVTKKLEFATKRKAFIERGAAEKAEREKINRLALITDAQTNIKNAEQKIKALLIENDTVLDATLKRCHDNEDRLNSQRDSIRARWKENAAQKFQLTQEHTVCPTCGQPLPQSLMEEKLTTLKADFLKSKAEVFQKLSEEANRVKLEIKDNEAEIIRVNSQIEDNITSTEELRKIADTYEETLQKLESSPTPEASTFLDNDENYKTIVEEVSQLEKQLNDTEGVKPDNSEADEELQQLQATLVTIQNNKATQKRVAQLKEELAGQNRKLAEVERKIDTADMIRKNTDSLIEDIINAKFQHVRFRLFRTQLNGTLQPYCEATVQGVPFGDLNTAARINAGIDIINTLSDYYDLSAPVVIDNAEAVNTLLPTKSQNIKLYVSNDKKLVFK